MAAAYGQPFAYTLTGFKWIGRVPGLAFGYEEAIGYCVDPEAVPDKDGITALIRVLTLAAELKATGQTLADRLDEIAERYGVHQTDQLSVRVDDLALIAAAMARLRARPPATLAGQPVTVLDLAAGRPDLPPTDGILITRRIAQGRGPAVGDRAQAQVLSRSAAPPELQGRAGRGSPPSPGAAGGRARGDVGGPRTGHGLNRGRALPIQRPFDEMQPVTHPAQVLPEVEAFARIHRLEVAGFDGFPQVVEALSKIPQLPQLGHPAHGYTLIELMFDGYR